MQSATERGARGFYPQIFRQTVKPWRIISATPQTAFETIGRPRNTLPDLRKSVRAALKTLKSTPGDAPRASRSTVRAAFGHPEVPQRATKAEKSIPLQRERPSHRPAQAPGPTCAIQPPGYIELSIATLTRTFSPSGPARPPHTPDPRGRRSSFWGGAGGWGLGAGCFWVGRA